MPCLTLFKQAGYKIEDYPKSWDTYKREITLPLYPQLSNLQVEYIVRNLVDAYYSIMNKDIKVI
jgi:dTDP-4-amino-4,6-dideoxygalactose transaminase